MTIRLKLELASGQSLKGAPLELLSKGVPIARAVVDAQGLVFLMQSLGRLNWRCGWIGRY